MSDFDLLGVPFRTQPVRELTDLVPGRLPLVAVKELAPLFNEHLGAHVVLSLQYQKQAWVGADLPHDFSAVVRGCHEEVRPLPDAIAETILSLGAVPVSGLELFDFSYLAHENEGIYSPQVMLRLDLNHEQVVVERVNETLAAALERQDEPGEALLDTLLKSSETRAQRLRALLEQFG